LGQVAGYLAGQAWAVGLARPGVRDRPAARWRGPRGGCGRPA